MRASGPVRGVFVFMRGKPVGSTPVLWIFSALDRARPTRNRRTGKKGYLCGRDPAFTGDFSPFYGVKL